MSKETSALKALKAAVSALEGDTVASTEPSPKGRPVVVTTAHRGVFFGYAEDTSGKTIRLNRGRNCVYWPASQKGFVGLATVGPLDGARVGPAADMTLHDVTCVLECSEAAAAAWEKAPWSR